MNYSLEGLLARDMKGIFVVRFCTTLRDELVALALAAIVGSVVRFTLSKPIGNVLSCAALSNQKFRDFRTTFGDVGLLTGDCQIKVKQKGCLSKIRTLYL